MSSNSEASEDDAVWQIVTAGNTHKRRYKNAPAIFKHINKAAKHFDLPTTSRNISTSSNAINESTKSNNKYASLDMDLDDDNETEENPENDKGNEEILQIKPPPIIIPNVVDIRAMVNNLSKLIKSDDFSYKSVKDGQVRLMIKNVQSYRLVVKHLEDKKINFHTYQLKDERAYRVVVKNIHFSTPIPLIRDEIQSLGHQVRNIMNIKSRITKQPLSMFFVDLEPNQNNKKIYDVKYLVNAVVKIEPPLKTNEILQCHRCQQFGHSKSYCRKAFTCVKCGLNHPTDNCPKSEDIPPQCANCLEHHTANYKGCKIYRDILKRKYESRSRFNNTNLNYNNNFFNRNNTTEAENTQFSYAQAVKNNSNNLQEQNLLKTLETFMQKQNDLMNQLMNMMQLIIQKLCV